MRTLISAVIRAYNEEKWIDRCLKAVSLQKLPIDDLIVVDNESIDSTCEIAAKYDAKIIDISREDFSYGRALNRGIEACKNEIVLILSAHCVPVDELWSTYLSVHLMDEDKSICGVYGRQEPLPETSDFDARDLWTTFREERQVQRSDYFFHNANSSIRRSLWEKHPFNEEINGVEDREWAKRLLSKNHSIVYEPYARVYHHHGIHQDRDLPRVRRVVEAIRYIRNSG
jgi:glycosyltransferase involved in cell wall biosynthesis